MNDLIESFYDDLAPYYHLIFVDWNQSIAWQSSILGPVLERATGKTSPYACEEAVTLLQFTARRMAL